MLLYSNIKILTLALVGAGAAYELIWVLGVWIPSKLKARAMRKKAAARLSERNSKKIELPYIAPEKKRRILELKAHEIVEAIKSEAVTAEEVLITYIERAQNIGRELNLNAEEPFEDALRRLAYLPNEGLLNGVPISVKDEMFQEGCHSTAGVIWRLDVPDPCDNVMLSQLRANGALPFVRGSAMQLTMWMETSNNIAGVAKNPWDQTRNTGGSSGGEAGLVASRCTPIAIGGDIGGSIRLPAAFCGVYGFKPTSRRTTGFGFANPHTTQIDPMLLLVKSTNGPIGRCVEDLTLVLRSWWNENLWKQDAYIAPVAFNRELYHETQTKKLKIGYYDYNGVFECAGCVKAVVRETVDKLRQDGHEVVEFNTDLISRGVDLYTRCAFSHGTQALLEMLQGEEPDFPYNFDHWQATHPWISKLIPTYVSLLGHKQLARLMSLPRNISLKEFAVLFEETAAYKAQFMAHWNSLGIDVVICPVFPTIAPKHTKTHTIMHGCSYTMVWNLLDYPAGVVPVRKVQIGEDNYESTVKDKKVKSCKEIMEGSVGMPIAIQVVGYPHQDEKVLGVMKIIEDYYKFYEAGL